MQALATGKTGVGHGVPTVIFPDASGFSVSDGSIAALPPTNSRRLNCLYSYLYAFCKTNPISKGLTPARLVGVQPFHELTIGWEPATSIPAP